jgi:hypothetical protein
MTPPSGSSASARTNGATADRFLTVLRNLDPTDPAE